MTCGECSGCKELLDWEKSAVGEMRYARKMQNVGNRVGRNNVSREEFLTNARVTLKEPRLAKLQNAQQT